MKICRLLRNSPPDGLVEKVQATLKVALLVHVLAILTNTIVCGGCVHDILTPTRGTSPQKYRLDIEALLDTKTKFNGKVQFSTKGPNEIESTARSKSVENYRFAATETNKTRPKRYVEDDKNTDPNGEEDSSSDSDQDSFNSTAKIPGRRITAQQSQKNNTMSQRTIAKNAFSKRASAKNSSTGSVKKLTVDLKKLFKPIRIKLFFDEENIEYANTSSEYKRLSQSLQLAVEKMAQILSVIPVDGPLLFSRTPELICGNFWSEQQDSSTDSKKKRRCAIARRNYEGEKCLDGFKIPEEHLRGYPMYKNNTDTPTHMLYEDGPGLQDTDTVIYVRSRKTSLCNSKDVIAYATYCQLDQHNRPIAGFANFCPDYLADILYDEDVLYLTSLHEFFHALGFTKDLFDKFQTCHPKVVQKRDDGTSQNKTKPSIEWACENRKNTVSFIEGRKHIVTPAVRKATQEHLNCTSKDGCPLENFVVPPLTSSHWEGRFMQGSLMAPSIGLPHLTVIDRITLSTFEDMGWYKVDYDHAENLAWGKDAGCEFGTAENCFEKSSPYFCQRKPGSIHTGCHYLHLDKGRCETDKYLDSCKVYKAHAGMECWREKNETRLTEWKGEIFSHESRCFVSDLVSQTTKYQPTESTKRLEGRCYLHRCNDSKTLEVKARGSEWRVCPEGSTIEFDGYEGGLQCPSASLLCGFDFDSTTAPAVGPTSVTHTGNSYCAKITISFPKLSEIHYQIGRREKQPEAAREAQQKLDVFLAKFINEIVAVTDIDETRVVDVKFVSSTSVEFTLLKDLDWTTLTPRDPISSFSPSDYDTSDDAADINADPLTYNYQEVSCTEAVRRLLVSVDDGNFQVPIDGQLYKANKINFTSSEEETNKLRSITRIPKEKPARTGTLAAIAVGSVCGAMLISVGVMIYWKSQITTAVSPAPPTPTSTDVRYQPNNGSTIIAPSENGSFGQLTFVA